MDELQELLAEASSPTTPPMRLQEIYWHSAKGFAPFVVRRALAANPNTPVNRLLDLALQCPRDFAHNPVLELYYLEDARFFAGRREEFWAALLCVDDLPDWLWQLAKTQPVGSYYYPGRNLLQSHVRIAGEAGPSWRATVEEARRQLLIKNVAPSARPSMLTPMLRYALMNRVVAEPFLGPMLEVAMGHEQFPWRRAAAQNAAQAGELYDLLRRAGSTSDLQFFARPDLSLTTEELSRVEQLGEWGRRVVARHPNTPLEWLEKWCVANEKISPFYCQAVLARPDAPAEQLHRIAQEGHYGLQIAVAQHANCTLEALHFLLQSPQRTVRRTVARSPKLPPEALRELARDADSFVRSALARNLSLPADVLQLLAEDENPVARAAVARHPQTPPAALQLLAADADETVRHAWQHRAAALAALTRPKPVRRPKSKKRKKRQDPTPTPPEGQFTADQLEMLQKLAASRDLLDCALAASHPHAPREVLENCLYNLHWQCRCFLAQNPALPLDLLQELTRDGHQIVRAAARDALAQR